MGKTQPPAGAATQYDDCSICMQPIRPDQVVQVEDGCKAVFHSLCLSDWLDGKPLKQRTCPLCRRPIPLNAPFGNGSLINAMSRSLVGARGPSNADLQGVDREHQMRAVLGTLHPSVRFEALSRIQRLELWEFLEGRSFYDTAPQIHPPRHHLSRQIPSEFRVRFDDVFGDSSVTRITCQPVQAGTGEVLDNSPVMIYHTISPELIVRLQQEGRPWEQANFLYQVASETYFLVPWYTVVTSLARDRYFGMHNLLPWTWPVDPRVPPGGGFYGNDLEALHSLLRDAIRELGHDADALENDIPPEIEALIGPMVASQPDEDPAVDINMFL